MANFLSESYGLSPATFGLLRDLIHEHTGLYFDDGKRDMLANRLAPRLVELGFPSYLDYYYLLRYDQEAAAEWGPLMDALTVPETYFWREIDAVRALVDPLIPQWAAANPGAALRIWSAACATGEEPLTIAMALAESGWLDRIPVQIEASDGSPAAVAAARRGRYRERSFRALPEQLRERYFTPAEGGWQVRPDLHRLVRWGVVNLRDRDAVAPRATAPFIFCRNVFIYFSRESVGDTVRVLAHHMPPRGCLFLGVAESLVRVSSALALREVGGAFVYVRE